MKSDMHVHTNYSDGSLPPKEVVTLAKRMGIEELAITDHDTMGGVCEAVEAGNKQGVQVVPGIEISAYDFQQGRKVHILGYNIEDRAMVEDACRPYLEYRHEAQRKALNKVIEAGYPISEEEVFRYIGPGGILYRQHIMHALVDRGFAISIYGEPYQKLFGRNGIAFVRSEYMDCFKALELVMTCGGIPVLAHPYQYDSTGLIYKLADKGLSGIETGSSKHTVAQTAELEKMACTYGLRKFQGSDFHGFYGEHPVPLGTF